MLSTSMVVRFVRTGCFLVLPSVFPRCRCLVLSIMCGRVSRGSNAGSFVSGCLRFFPGLGGRIFSPGERSVGRFFLLRHALKGKRDTYVVCYESGQSMLKDDGLGSVGRCYSGGGVACLAALSFLCCTCYEGGVARRRYGRFVRRMGGTKDGLPVVSVARCAYAMRVWARAFRRGGTGAAAGPCHELRGRSRSLPLHYGSVVRSTATVPPPSILGIFLGPTW